MSDDDLIRIAWVVLAVLVASAEIVVPGFFLLPFGLGAGVAAISAFAGAPFWLQLVVFVISSAVFFALLRPLARRLNRIEETAGVGANRLLNQRGIVTDALGPDEPGMVRIDREDWRASTDDEAVIPVGAAVRVIEVRGTRVIVSLDAPAAPDTPDSPTQQGATS